MEAPREKSMKGVCFIYNKIDKHGKQMKKIHNQES